ncbi:MAG: lipopolysaccharide assembly protein LapA domain-containing protein [Porticoccaceae bacterium]
MRRTKALFWALLALPMAGIGVWFVQDNDTSVALVLLGFPLGELPLGIWLTLTFLIGVLSTVLATVPVLGAARLRQRRLEREVARLKTIAK